MILEIVKLSKKIAFKQTAFSQKQFVKVVDDISISIKEGETLGVVGESGSGKTTLANLCAGITKPSDGKIFFNGNIIQSDKNYYSKRQVVFQNALGSLNKKMKVSKIIEEPLVIQKIGTNDEKKEKVLQTMKMAGLNLSDADKYPHQLSGGQQQRVSIARALITNPKMLILDEPVSSLDVSIRGQILNLLMDLQAEKKLTYLIISHNFEALRNICSNIAVMYMGKILEIGTSDLMFDYPFHPYTKALISAIPIADPRIEKNRQHVVLKGETPGLLDRPKGCAFSNRCSEVQDVCKREEPELLEIEPDRFVACHLRKSRNSSK